MKLDWFATHDVDEYIRVLVQNSDPSLLEPVLQDFLKGTFPNKDEIGALLMKSSPYGRNQRDPNETRPDLLIDYMYRKKGNPPNGREKLIVNPHTVDYLDVHRVEAGKQTLILDHRQVHINHYKNPEKGPNQSGDPSGWVKDDGLAKYHQVVMERLLKKPNASQVYSNN